MSSKNSSHPDADSPPAAPPALSAGRLPLEGTEQSPGDLVPEPVELAVILAAGAGSRLNRQGSGQPKPTVSLLGLSLGERAILAGMDAGLCRFVVVLGHEKEQVRAHFERVAEARSCEVSFVEASNWRLGNGASGLAAAETVGDSRFVLMMVDHLVDPRLIGAVRSAVVQQGEIYLGVDHDRDQLFDPDDATKVQLDGNKVIRIGKHLDEWAAADTTIVLTFLAG